MRSKDAVGSGRFGAVEGFEGFVLAECAGSCCKASRPVGLLLPRIGIRTLCAPQSGGERANEGTYTHTEEAAAQAKRKNIPATTGTPEWEKVTNSIAGSS